MSVVHVSSIGITHDVVIDLQVNERSVLRLRESKVIENELSSGEQVIESEVRHNSDIVSAGARIPTCSGTDNHRVIVPLPLTES